MIRNTPDDGGYRFDLFSSGGNNPTKENAYNMWLHHSYQGHIVATDIKTGAVLSDGVWGVGCNGIRVPWSSGSERKLVSKIISDLKGHDFNAAIAGAELPKTLQGVVASTRAIAQSYSAFRRGRYEDAFRTLSRAVQGIRPGNKPPPLRRHDVSDAVLAMNYGWKPLANDIYESMQAVELATAGPRVYKSKFRATQPQVYLHQGVNVPFYQLVKLSKEYRISWRETVTFPRSLGLLNPAPVVWELLPFSFIVDWFIPIGSYLEEVSYMGPMSQMAAASSLKTVKDGTLSSKNCGFGGPYYRPHHSTYCSGPKPVWRHSVTTCRSRQVWLDRWVGTGIAVRPPSFNDLDRAFSLTHLANAAALITSLSANR